MPETRAQTLDRLRHELPRRKRQARRLRTRLTAVRGRIHKLVAGIRRRNQPSLVQRPHEVIITAVRNQSARSEPIKLIVLHDTESGNVKGTADLQGVISWFNNPAAQASAHVIVDADGNAARCVEDDRKAWHVASFNSKALGIEQVGHATQTSWPDAQLRTVARYIAHWSQKHGIPLERSTTHGVCQHQDLGAAGGGHDDCGPSYPFDHVLQLARQLLA